jgi:hypothetical protein
MQELSSHLIILVSATLKELLGTLDVQQNGAECSDCI